MFLNTERMIIRNFTIEDLNDLQEILGADETMEYLEPAYDLKKTEHFLRDFCIDKSGAFAAVLKETGKVIGYILFHEIEETIYEIGWIFNRDYWKRGFAYESCHAVMEYGFSELSCCKIIAETIDAEKSVGFMKKLGMKFEGMQDELYSYSVGRTEWKMFCLVNMSNLEVC